MVLLVTYNNRHCKTAESAFQTRANTLEMGFVLKSNPNAIKQPARKSREVFGFPRDKVLREKTWATGQLSGDSRLV